MKAKPIVTASILSLFLGVGHAALAPAQAAEDAAPVSVVRAPTDLPGPIARSVPKTVTVELDAVEVVGRLADDTTYRYWTFNAKVPGPMVRVRVGDTVVVKFKNASNSWMNHNVDFHAVTGPGGGAEATVTEPGQVKTFKFKALKPGLFVYHCATPMVAQHISNGMYGMILVEPEGGLPKVDHEFYFMQGEIYTEEPYGTTGELTESYEKLLDEKPEYYVFNGAVGALTKEAPLKAEVGDTVRIYFGVGGPNKTSSFHVIGEIFDKVYNFGSISGGATSDVQTVTVAPGGATIAQLRLEVPGTYKLVDHALSRLERGLVGALVVDGPENPEIFDDNPTGQVAQR